jgi:hypothetical protein
MPTTPLAVNKTLALFTERVRGQTSTISEQESGINKLEMNNIIQSSVMFVRSLLGKVVDGWYSTNATVTESSNNIGISTLDIADISGLRLYDATHGSVPIVSDTEFDTFRTLYAGTTIVTEQMYARVTTTADAALKIQTVRGATKATPGTLTLTYPRNPIKATASASKIDLPEKYIPAAEDVAAMMVFRRQAKAPPSDIDKRVLAFLQMTAQGG